MRETYIMRAEEGGDSEEEALVVQQLGVMKKGGGGEEQDQEEKKKDGLSEIRLAIEELSLMKVHDEKQQQQLPTLPFLAVCNLMLQVLDKIGPTMAVLRHDMQRNIQRLEDLYITNPSIYSNLGDILKKEDNEGSTRKTESCARAILWLTRSMDFTVALLERLERDSELTLEQVVEEAYNITLNPWHGWISTAAYKVAIKLIPERKIFISLLMSKEQDYKTLKGDMQNLILSFQPILNEIHAHLKECRMDRLKSI